MLYHCRSFRTSTVLYFATGWNMFYSNNNSTKYLVHSDVLRRFFGDEGFWVFLMYKNPSENNHTMYIYQIGIPKIDDYILKIVLFYPV